MATLLANYRGLLFILVLASIGCQLNSHKTRWRSAETVRPADASRLKKRAACIDCIDGAESIYAEAVELELRGNAACVDMFFQVAKQTWPLIEQEFSFRDVPCGRAQQLYRSALVRLMCTGQKFKRFDPRGGLNLRSDRRNWQTIPVEYHGFVWQPEDFNCLEPVGNYSTKELRHAYCSCGAGVPFVAVRCRQKRQPFMSSHQPFGATALLRPAAVGSQEFVLELYDPLSVSTTQIADRTVPLARDLTAPLVYQLSNADREDLRAFLQPGTTTRGAGLFMLEPYQPGKIPIIFIHGLLSDPFTWADVANELRARPKLNDRYQIWAFEYPTGEPFLRSAALLREQLAELCSQVDPTGSDEALAETVLVGHSMGGLISKLLVTCSGESIWRAVSNQPFESIVATPETRMKMARVAYFNPSPNVSRVVFVGTPHGGSSWASRLLGRVGSALVQEPNSMVAEHRQLIDDNPNTFSREFSRRIPTSVDLLEPESPLLRAIATLPLAHGVKLHSVIGTGKWMVGSGESDGVVSVASARTSNVETERLVDAHHSQLPQATDSVAEVLCILHRHLTELDGASN